MAQTAITRKNTALNRTVVLTVLWTATLDMFSSSMRRTGFFLCKQDYGGIKCLTSVFCTRTTSKLIGGDKQKTMDDLDGPSFLTSLYWLFGKGYFQTTHQMQVNIHKKVLGRTLNRQMIVFIDNWTVMLGFYIFVTYICVFYILNSTLIWKHMSSKIQFSI